MRRSLMTARRGLEQLLAATADAAREWPAAGAPAQRVERGGTVTGSTPAGGRWKPGGRLGVDGLDETMELV